uniref:Uncharacterized protein n=1 Tax=Ditylenchus dipsaci TaxID=166011 RepID=A0A915CW67_9BILA
MSQPYEHALLHNYNAHFYGSQPIADQRPSSYLADKSFPRSSKPQFRPNTRSRTVPARAQAGLNSARKRTSRVIDEAQLNENYYYRTYSGPTKRPAPLYRKKQENRPLSYQDMTGHVPNSAYRSNTQEYCAMPSTFQPPHNFNVIPEYMPSYSTFPPTSMYPPTHAEVAWSLAKKRKVWVVV